LPDVTGSTGVKAAFYRIAGPTAAFSVFGVQPISGADGQLVTLVNTTNNVMTIKNNASSTAANGFKISGGSDLVSVAGGSSVTIQYNKTDAKWYVTGSQNFTVTTGAIATGDITTTNNGVVTMTNNTGRLVGSAGMTINVADNGVGQKGVVPGTTGLTSYQAYVTDNNGNPGWAKVPNAALGNSSVTVNPGTGMSGGGTVALGGTITLTNSAPDQTVTLTNGSGISATGTYPNFTINNTGDLSNTNEAQTLAGQGTTDINLTTAGGAGGGTITLQGTGGTSVSRSGNTFTINSTGSGLTGASTTNYVPKWTTTSASSGTLSSTSSIFDNGNVGIGTISPGQKLEVNGNTLIHNGGTTYNNSGAAELQIGYALAATAGTPGEVSRLALQPYSHTGGPFKFVSRDDATKAYLDLRYGTGNGISMNSNGDVGINTQTPASKLELGSGSIRLPASGYEGAGQIQSTALVRFGNVSNAQGIYAQQISLSDSWSDNDTYTQSNGIYSKGNVRIGGATNAFYANTSTGKVGIGTTTPNQKLHVNGGVEIAGPAFEGNTSARVYRNLVTANWDGVQTGVLVIQTNVPQDDHTMTETTIDVKRTYSDGNTNCEIIASGYWSSESNGGFSGLGLTNYCNDKLRVRFMRNSSTGMVAIVIGETNTSWSYPVVSIPQLIAHYNLVSDSYADGWTASFTTNISGYINSDDVPDITTAKPTAGSADYIQNQTASAQTANFNISGNGYFGGNVGIGNTSPSQRLTVGSSNGQSSALIAARGNGNDFEFGHTNTAGYGSTIGSEVNSGFPFIAFMAEAGTTINTYKTRGNVGRIINSTTDGSLRFGRAASSNADNQSLTEDMRIDGSGNLGIGTSSPGSKVDIQGGDLNVSGQGRFKGWYTQGTGLAAEIGISAGQAYLYSYNRTASSYQPINLSGSTVGIGHSGATTDLFVASSGKVGVGTSSPTEALSVNGGLTTANGQVKRDFFTYNSTTSGTAHLYIKTNIPTSSCIMYRFLLEGYQYNNSVPIFTETVGYADCNPSPSAITHNSSWYYNNTITLVTAYKSSDGYVTLDVNPVYGSTSGNNYYIGFSMSCWLTNPAGNAFDVKVLAYGNSAY
jgi:hypothetical protein